MSDANTTNANPSKLEALSGALPADVEQRVKHDAAAVADVARHEFGAIRGEVEEQAKALADEAKTQLGEVAEKAKSIAAEQKDYLATQLADVAGAVSRVAAELGDKQSPTSGYARTLADGLQDFSRTVSERDVDSLMGLAEDFGRRQPAAFMGAAALAGFVASRFLMASGQRRSVGPAAAVPPRQDQPTYRPRNGNQTMQGDI